MQTSTVILETGSKYNIIRRLTLLLDWHRHACLDYKITPDGNAIKNSHQTQTVWNCSLQNYLFGCFWFQSGNFVGTRFLSHHDIFIFCIYKQLEFTRGNLSLLKSDIDEATVKQLETIENESSGPFSNTHPKQKDFCIGVMHQEVKVWKQVTLTPIKVWVQTVTKISDLSSTQTQTFPVDRTSFSHC